ncbi:MBL fold metallo-hydrolase [Natrinema halophilum]|uniref:MBL fold metallo-hydrolase n=1 Tax=Natrinema halophilum TaxID=1699371 RepID=A0A7D5K7B1_9EURY|nr:MBL fold metallo-hydrolase [Natrinema halophilum]QLG49823.1 MBL fold metallo-hydrolase [Natrinema halophilum]
MSVHVELTYYGLSSFEVCVDGTRLLFDPWITDPPWQTPDIDAFDDVEYIFVTHGASDHLGDTFEIASRSGATVITEPAVVEHLVGLGLTEDAVERVIWGNRFELEGYEVRAMETRHLSYFESSVGNRSGMAIGFYLDFGPTSLYYVGDTSLFSDLELFVDQYEPDLVLLPVGSAPGAHPPLPPDDAAVAANWFDGVDILPVHYIPGSDELDVFRDEYARLSGTKPRNLLKLSAGETQTLTDYSQS